MPKKVRIRTKVRKSGPKWGHCLLFLPIISENELVAGDLTDRPGQVPNSVGPGLAKMLMGIALLGYSQVAGMYFYPTYMEEEAFFALPYFKKLGYISITGMVYMYKVILRRVLF